MNFHNTYKVDLRELNFLLWEQFEIDKDLLLSELAANFNKEFIQQLLFHARDFAYKELGPTYQQSDREGCQLLDDGQVKVPDCFNSLWQKYLDAQWGRLGAPPEYDGLGAPYIIGQIINEIFMGANPSFMIYSGFCNPALYLIERFGSSQLKQIFNQKLATNTWSACLCMTEPQAGTDVGALTSKAVLRQDGEYSIKGGKIFISAGMHQLTENIVYIVLARVEGAPASTTGLSCFVVPKFIQDRNGQLQDNHVKCVRLENKMGLHGCATAQLSFGEDGECKGFLLGDRENIGLRQLTTMMHMARISTGIYALGLANRAYMNAAEYAQQRIQGAAFNQAFNPQAEKVALVKHIDVKRMLLEMKSKVEGCRALIVKLTYHQSWVNQIEFISKNQQSLDKELKQSLWRHQSLVNLLTPIVKAYTSDQAWRIAEQAIQVYGGHGYISDNPVEQVARDVKILSIWEGTNFIQSASLIREQLAMGRESKLLALFIEEISTSLNLLRQNDYMLEQLNELDESMKVFQQTHQLMGQWVKQQKLEMIFGVATRFLEMMAELTLSWLLVEAAIIAKQKLDNLQDESDQAFYLGKIASANYYVKNVLPGVKSKAEIIAKEDDSSMLADVDIFLTRSEVYA